MKFLILLFITFSAFANEVIIVNGQKLVLIEKKTASSVEKILNRNGTVEELKAALKKDKNFCSDAILTYRVRPEKCEKIMTTDYLYNDLLSDVPEFHDTEELREIISKYIAILILM